MEKPVAVVTGGIEDSFRPASSAASVPPNLQAGPLKVCALCPCVCSAGVGRTGVFITLSIVLERMRYEGVVDIFQTVKMLRTQRPAMVQTEVRGHLMVFRHC